MFESIRERELIEPFIKALLVETGLDEDASVFYSAIELTWQMDGHEFLFLFLQATPEQIERAARSVLAS